jgi:hypothetical protein
VKDKELRSVDPEERRQGVGPQGQEAAHLRRNFGRHPPAVGKTDDHDASQEENKEFFKAMKRREF